MRQDHNPQPTFPVENVESEKIFGNFSFPNFCVQMCTNGLCTNVYKMMSCVQMCTKIVYKCAKQKSPNLTYTKVYIRMGKIHVSPFFLCCAVLYTKNNKYIINIQSNCTQMYTK